MLGWKGGGVHAVGEHQRALPLVKIFAHPLGQGREAAVEADLQAGTGLPRYAGQLAQLFFRQGQGFSTRTVLPAASAA